MTLIEWKPEFYLGIPKMDADHHYMIGLINGLNEQLQSGEHQTFIIGILEELYSSAAKHFAHEEAIMRECGYDEYEEHEADHRRLLDRVTTWLSDYPTKRLHEGMAKWLANWFCNHFQSHDARLHRPVVKPAKLKVTTNVV
jgi:hemerythrin-like metal-binding protein